MTDVVERLKFVRARYAEDPRVNVLEVLDRAIDEIERLRAERDALREDAERYRWLRLSPHALDHPIGLVGAALDAAIDAARREA